jgi:hypothetical protein
MHIFDIDFTPFDQAAFQSSIGNGTVELHQGDSSAALATLPDRSFDFIYIDGDHAYEGVVKDLAMAAQKIKADGWIVCNDYTIYSPVEKMQYGVYRAVNEFCWREGFEIVFLGLHYWSYHDVALRRMSPDAVASAGQAPKPAKARHTGMVQLAGKNANLLKPAPASSNPPRVFLAGETFSSGTNRGIQAPAVSSGIGNRRA